MNDRQGREEQPGNRGRGGSRVRAWLGTIAWWQALIALIALAAPVATVSYGPRWLEWQRNWCSAQDLAAARALSTTGHSAGALRRLVDAFERTPWNPSVVRALAHATAEPHPEQAKYLFDRLAGLRLTTDADHIAHGQVLARLNDHAGARAVLAEVAEPARANSSTWWMAHGQLALSAGRFAEARDAYARAHALAPAELAPLLGVVRGAAAAGPGPHDGDAELLLDCLEKKPSALNHSARAECLDLLATLPLEDAVLRARLADCLERQPAPALSHKVAACLLRYPSTATAAERAAALAGLDQLLVNHSHAGVEERCEAASVLLAHGALEPLVSWLPGDLAMLDASLYARRMDALMGLGRWREVAVMAAHRDAPVLPTSRHLLQALVILNTPQHAAAGDRANAQVLLQRAMVEAGVEGRQGAFVAIGQVALDFDLCRLATDAFAHALELPFGWPVPLDAFVLAARRDHRPLTWLLRQLELRALVDRSNLDLQLHLAHLRLLAGTQVEVSAFTLDQIAQRLPDDPRVRFLAAFARYRLNDFAGAAATLTPMPRHRWHRGEVAVIAAILAGAGDAAQAARIAAGFDPGITLFEEEQQLLADNNVNMVALKLRAGTPH